jgi:serine/threonine protein kinase
MIGRGAFGTVSMARDKATGELLAVKSIDCNEDTKAELLAMENEIKILQKLDCPWIIKFLGDNCTVDNGVRKRNMLMEYMAGGSLLDIVNQFGGKLNESIIRTYTTGILNGIHYLHSQGIVHSDIKARNVLVGSSGVKLADFGSARIVSRGNGEAKFSGTTLWMAPEVVKQMEQGPPADIWSLGCTVLEMATGKPPWNNISHPLVAMFKIGSPHEVPEFPESLSSEGHDFLEKCFRKDPEERWTSAQLLNHPFLQEANGRGCGSHTNNLDIHNVETSYSATSSCANSAVTCPRTVPILSLPRKLAILAPQEAMDQESGENKVIKGIQRKRKLQFMINCNDQDHRLIKRPKLL